MSDPFCRYVKVKQSFKIDERTSQAVVLINFIQEEDWGMKALVTNCGRVFPVLSAGFEGWGAK